MMKIWELKQSKTDESILEMFIYGDVQGDYFDAFEWKDVESETSANYFKNELSKYPDTKQINIFINSYGGSVFEGTAIYSQLKRHTAQKTVYVDGFACSVASIIAMAGDKVVMPKNAMMMIHNAWNVSVGNSAQLRKSADDLDVIMKGNRQAYLEKSNGKITEEKLIELLENETWLTAEQCVEYGFADEVLSKDADMSKAQQLLQKVNNTIEQKLSYNKAISAQLKEFAVEKKEPIQKIDPVLEPVQKTNAEKLTEAFNKKNGGNINDNEIERLNYANIKGQPGRSF